MNLLLLATPAVAEVPWTGITRTQGGAEVRLTLAPAADDTVTVTLFFPEYEKVTLEGTLTLKPGCAASTFDAVRARIDGACRSADARLPDRHPIYDYVADNRVRCVLGEGTAPGFCRLQYTGWFQVAQVLPASPDATELGRARMRETFTGDALDSVRWLHVDRGTPAVLAWGSRRAVYLLRSLR